MSSCILIKFDCVLFLSRKCSFLFSLPQSVLGICMWSMLPICITTIPSAVLSAASDLLLLTLRCAEKSRHCWPNSGLKPQQGHLASDCTRLLHLAALGNDGRFALHGSEGHYGCIIVCIFVFMLWGRCSHSLAVAHADSSYSQKYTFKQDHSKSQERNYTALHDTW